MGSPALLMGEFEFAKTKSNRRSFDSAEVRFAQDDGL
jgi:hypothetical protein